jgi:hypothetical protein
LAVLYLLCLALLAGWGLDDLVRRGVSRRVIAVAACVAVAPVLYTVARSRSSWDLVGDAFAVAFGVDRAPALSDPSVGGVVRGAATLQAVAIAGAACLLLAFLRGRALAVGAIVLVAADLAWAGVGYNPAIDRAVASQPETGAIRELQRTAPQRFVTVGDLAQNAIPMDHKIPEARGYDLPVEKRFDKLWRSKVAPEFPSQVGPLPAFIPLTLPRVDGDRLRYLSFLGVSRVLQAPTEPKLDVPDLRLVYDRPDARIYANDAALPRAFVVGAQRRVRDAYAEITSDAFDAREAALVESGRSEGEPGLAGPAQILHTENDRQVLESRTTRPGILVVTESWAPGWHAVMGGEELKVERVDYLYRGVRVPAGTHIVEFTYRPLSWRIGWIVSLAAFVALLGGFLWRPEREDET